MNKQALADWYKILSHQSEVLRLSRKVLEMEAQQFLEAEQEFSDEFNNWDITHEQNSKIIAEQWKQFRLLFIGLCENNNINYTQVSSQEQEREILGLPPCYY